MHSDIYHEDKETHRRHIVLLAVNVHNCSDCAAYLLLALSNVNLLAVLDHNSRTRRSQHLFVLSDEQVQPDISEYGKEHFRLQNTVDCSSDSRLLVNVGKGL